MPAGHASQDRTVYSLHRAIEEERLVLVLFDKAGDEVVQEAGHVFAFVEFLIMAAALLTDSLYSGR